MVLRQSRTGLEQKFYELCERVIPETGLELYDLDYLPGSGELRVYIRNPETMTAVIEDCIAVDRALSPFLEEEWTPSKLSLEVSSPGLFRSLRTVAQFKETKGEKVALTLTKKIEDNDLPPSIKNNKKLIGTLLRADESGVELDIEGHSLAIGYDMIKKANLETEIATSNS